MQANICHLTAGNHFFIQQAQHRQGTVQDLTQLVQNLRAAVQNMTRRTRSTWAEEPENQTQAETWLLEARAQVQWALGRCQGGAGAAAIATCLHSGGCSQL